MDYSAPKFVPSGIWQAEYVDAVKTATLGETVYKFRLTEPEAKAHPQKGLGGRIVCAWLAVGSPNPVTKSLALEREDELVRTLGALSLESAKGRLLRIQVERIVMRSDPSAYKSAVVAFLPLHDRHTKPYEREAKS